MAQAGKVIPIAKNSSRIMNPCDLALLVIGLMGDYAFRNLNCVIGNPLIQNYLNSYNCVLTYLQASVEYIEDPHLLFQGFIYQQKNPTKNNLKTMW